MNKTEARAVLALAQRIDSAIESFENKMTRAGISLEWYNAYPLATLYHMIARDSYSGLPVGQAERIIERGKE